MHEEYHPVVNVQDSSNKIEFKIPGNSNHYLDLADRFSELSSKWRIKMGIIWLKIQL